MKRLDRDSTEGASKQQEPVDMIRQEMSSAVVISRGTMTGRFLMHVTAGQ